jgi:very-short-patch-repair endonuclease
MPTKPAGDKSMREVEILLETHLRELGISLDTVVREYLFSRGRKWAFDYAIPSRKIAIEIEGGTEGKSRHTSSAGFQKDLDKYNWAVAEGWTLFRFTTRDIEFARDLPALRFFITTKFRFVPVID